MARSRKKNPVYSHTNAGSMKWWKRNAHKRLRQAFRLRIMSCEDWDNLNIPEIREVSNIWSSPQDGGHRITEKPDDLECLRERIEDSIRGYTWRITNFNYYIGSDGHYINKAKCECITNKNSWYYRVFRK